MAQRQEGWAMSFTVADEVTANALADALSEFGFARVEGWPTASGWSVSASVSGRLGGLTGYRALDRAAIAVARPLRVRPGMSIYGSHAHRRRLDPPIMRDRPGAPPPIPDLPQRQAPPAARLPVSPDLYVSSVVALASVDRVDWASIDDVRGPATTIPALLQNLWVAVDDSQEDLWAQACEDLAERLMHAGSVYPATVASIPLLVQLALACGRAQRRVDLIAWITCLAGAYHTALLLDADVAAVEDRPATTNPVAFLVYDIVGRHAPALLST